METKPKKRHQSVTPNKVWKIVIDPTINTKHPDPALEEKAVHARTFLEKHDLPEGWEKK